MNSTLRSRFVDDGVAMLSNERLLLALYDRLLADLDGARAALETRQPAAAHDKLIHAQCIVEELHLALDTDVWAGARELGSIYQQARALLVDANVTKSAAPVAECQAMLAPLAEAWRSAYAQTTAVAPGPVAGRMKADANSWGA